MLLKNLKYAFRNLRRDKFYTLLNGFGLSVGMTVALLIFMWAVDEISYDNYHKNNGRNYRVLSHMSFGGERGCSAATPSPLASAAKTHVPEVQHAAMTMKIFNGALQVNDFLIDIDHGHLVDPAILEIFDFEFVKGDPKKALTDPKSIVITEGIAAKIFGNENPMGQTIRVRDRVDVVVTGVIKDTPYNTHFKVDCLVPFEENSKKFMSLAGFDWNSHNFGTYVLLRPGVDAELAAKKMTDLIPIDEDDDPSERTYFELQPVKDVHLGSKKLTYSSIPRGNWAHIRLLSFIGLIILLIASINYVNLTTARAAHRAKAAGIRKVIGASKSQLVSQHLLEAFCLAGGCAFVAFTLAHICLPSFETLSGKTFATDVFGAMSTISLLAIITFTTVLLSGVQPALQLSSFRPAEVLKGSHFKGIAGRSNLRKILVITQFVSSAALIICTLFMLRQLDFVRASNLGYEKEHVFSFRHRHENPAIFTNALKGQPGIIEVSKSDQSIVNISSQMAGFEWEGMPTDKKMSINQIHVDHQFKDFFGLEIIEGRWFHPGEDDTQSFIINEAAVRALQLENPIGKWIEFWGDRGTVVGIVKDFHYRSFHHNIEQLIIRNSTDYLQRTYVKTTGAHTQEAIASAEKVFKALQPNAIFEYRFLDESYNNLYRSETRIGKLFLIFAIIAILISCLGIFGLATYTAERRFKEIGIRKVLGASVLSIVQLLSKDFLQLIFIALAVAIPIAWYFMDQWLSNFAYHVALDWWVFACAGMLAIGIAIGTVGLQSFRAAIANPVESIKAE